MGKAGTSGSKGKKGGNFFQKGQEIRRCNDLRCRIKTYCKQQGMTQPSLAEKMGVSASQMNSFMTGKTLTGSIVYTRGMNYLRVRMPLSQCSVQDREQIRNDKWVLVM